MLRKAIFHLGFCISLAIGSPFCSHRTDPGPEPTCASIISAPPLPTTSLQSSNAIYDEKPCVAIKIIHGVTIESPCRYRIRAKRGIPPTPSENTPTLLDDVTTFYVYVTEAITSSSPRSSFSATTLVPTSTTPKATATLVSSLLLHINSPAGATKTSLAQSHGTPPGTLQSSAHISLSTTSVSSNPTSKNTISTSISSHSQSPTTRLSPPKPTFGISDVPTGASTIPSPTLPPTHGLTSIMHEPSAMPVATHSPILPMGVDQISSVITDISLLLSVLAETQASATSLMGSGQTLNTHTLLTSPSVTTHAPSVTPAPLPALGMAGVSSVITDITLLESILAATLTSAPTPVTTHVFSVTPAPLPALGMAGISSVITDITLLESILAATLTAIPTPVTAHVSSITPAAPPVLGMAGISSVITDITLLESILAATLTSVPIPVTTHVSSVTPAAPPALGMAEISSVITDITLLESILAATLAAIPTPITTHVSSITPAPPPALGMVGISSVITDITLLESILAATLTSVLTPASTQTMTKASMAASSSYTLAPLGSSGNKSITSTRTIIRTASPPNATGGKKPVRVDKPLWSAGETAVECTCQCRGRRFTITATKSV